MKLNKYFMLEQRETTVRKEIIAGVTTFMTMAYVLAVQPAAIVGFGSGQSITDSNGLVITKAALLVTCALASGMITLFMGLYANIPLALSTAMGTNFLLGTMVSSGERPFGWIMGLLLISGLIFILISVLGIRKLIVEMIPKNLKIAMPTAVGFFIAYLGFKNTGIATFEGGLGRGDFQSPQVLLTLFTLLLIAVLHVFKVRGAILIAIIVATIIGIPLRVTQLPPRILAIPAATDIGNILFAYDFSSLLADIPTSLVWLFILFTGDFFSTLSCVMAVGVQADMVDEEGNFPDIQKPFLVDSVGTTLGSAMGCTTISTYIESITGVEAGGRTGLASVVTAILFFIALFFAPLFLIIPAAATGAALIFVGFSMLSGFRKLDFSDYKDCFGPFLMILTTVFTSNIPTAICLGILADVFIKVITGNYKEVHPLMYVLCIPLILYFLV